MKVVFLFLCLILFYASGNSSGRIRWGLALLTRARKLELEVVRFSSPTGQMVMDPGLREAPSFPLPPFLLTG